MLLSGLAFHLTQAWILLNAKLPWKAATVLYTKLRSTVRRLVGPVTAKDALEEVVSRSAEQFGGSLSSEWRHEDLLWASEAFKTEDGQEVLDRLAKPAQTAVMELQDQIERGLGEIHRQLLRFGRLLNEAIYPANVHRQMNTSPGSKVFASRPTKPTAASTHAASVSPPDGVPSSEPIVSQPAEATTVPSAAQAPLSVFGTGSDRSGTRLQPPEWWLPTHSRGKSKGMPSNEWTCAIKDRWQEVKAVLGPLPEIMPNSTPGARLRVKALVERIDETVRNILRQTSGLEPFDTNSSAFVLKPAQKVVLKALTHKAMKTDTLAGLPELAELGVDRRSLFDRGKSPGILAELMKRGLVKNHDRLGYYRPDAPPPDLQAPQR